MSVSFGSNLSQSQIVVSDPVPIDSGNNLDIGPTLQPQDVRQSVLLRQSQRSKSVGAQSMEFSYRYEDLGQPSPSVRSRSPIGRLNRSKPIVSAITEFDLFSPESNGYENIALLSVKIKTCRWIQASLMKKGYRFYEVHTKVEFHNSDTVLAATCHGNATCLSQSQMSTPGNELVSTVCESEVVMRRYSDFTILYNELRDQNLGLFIPPLPGSVF